MPSTQTDRLCGLTTSVAVKIPVQISADYNVIPFGEQEITSTTFTGTRAVIIKKGMRVLLTGQANPIDNGIWEAMPAKWRRVPDFGGTRDAVNGTLVFSIHGDCWQAQANDPVRIGYDPLHFLSTYPFSGDANLFRRSLRVPNSSIIEMPSPAEMAAKIVAISGGRPVGGLPEDGAATDVMIELVKATGANLIGTSLPETVQSELDSNKSAYYLQRNVNYLARAYKKLKYGEQITICCVGDSITAGFDVSSPDKVPPENGDQFTHAKITYPKALETILNLLTSSAVSVINRGYSGDTAKLCFNRWTTNPIANVAHIMLGINDAAGEAGATFDEYLQYYDLIIKRYINWGCGVVIHTATPQSFNSSDKNAPHFTQAIRAISRAYGCPIFESETSIQYAIFNGVYSDVIHFNTHGYNKYGNAVGAFIMSGGWVQEPKMTSGEIHLQNGRGSEGIGYYKKNIEVGNSDGSYLNNQSTGQFSAANDRISYSFFMDTEFMDVYGVGNFEGLDIALSYVADAAYTGDTRGPLSTNRITIKTLTSNKIVETMSYNAKPGRDTIQSGNMTHLGCYVGRGWKTLSISAPEGFAGLKYCNGIVLKGKEALAVRQNASSDHPGSFKPGELEVQIYQYPYASYVESSVTPPAADSLPATVYFPLPFAMYPYNSQYGHYYDTLPVEIMVSCSAGFAKTYIMRNGAGEGDFLIVKEAGNLDSLVPKSAKMVHKAYNNTTGELGPFTDGFSGAGSTPYLALSFSGTPAYIYSLVLTGHHKSGNATTGI